MRMRNEDDFPVGKTLMILAVIGMFVFLMWADDAPTWALWLGVLVGFTMGRVEILSWRLEGLRLPPGNVDANPNEVG